MKYNLVNLNNKTVKTEKACIGIGDFLRLPLIVKQFKKTAINYQKNFIKDLRYSKKMRKLAFKSQ